MHRLLTAVAASLAVGTAAAGSAAETGDVAALLTRIGARVEQYFARAQSIVCRETVRLQQVGPDLTFDGPARRLVYELRVAWEASTPDGKASEASVQRQLISINGRPPKPGDEPECVDPKSVSYEPLAMFLPSQQRDQVFTSAGTSGRRRKSVMLDFKDASPQAPQMMREGDCLSFSLPGRGRVWVEPTTADVLRVDTRSLGVFEFPAPKDAQRFAPLSPVTWAIERFDSSIRYRAVTFHDPEETVMLPASIETTQMTRQSRLSGLRIYHTFSDYRRFFTDARIVGNPEER